MIQHAQITVECICPTLGSPADKLEARAEATFTARAMEIGDTGAMRLEFELDRLDVWIDGKPSLEDLPGCYHDQLERLARKCVEL